MKRRAVLQSLVAAFGSAVAASFSFASELPTAQRLRARVRPGDARWPSPKAWKSLSAAVGGQLQALKSPFTTCTTGASTAACDSTFAIFSNPIAVGDDPALTQNLGWLDAWSYAPSAYVVAARTTSDVVAAVNFARTHNLRVVVKGGGHSYQGTSSAPDSLLIWTRHMNSVVIHDNFVAAGANEASGKPAVSVQAGAVWFDAYNVVTTQTGRYVQGGGCTSVGVAGHVQSGGFGSFSKGFGTAASNLLEAEIVTADGHARVVNAQRDPDLFWALKGGGGGAFGVVTRLTLATHALPEKFGVVNLKIQASSDEAYQRLAAATLAFYRDHLATPHWGEQMVFNSGGELEIKMVFQSMDKASALLLWKPYLDWISTQNDLKLMGPPFIVDLPARAFWNADILSRLPGLIQRDDRPDANPAKFVWAGDAAQCGRVWSGYHSMWLSEAALNENAITGLAEGLVKATASWSVELHFNKGLAGADVATLERVRDSAMNPAVNQAFALAIIAGSTPPSLLGASGHGTDLNTARKKKVDIDAAIEALRAATSDGGSYVAESDYFLANWQESHFGENYARLQQVKHEFDPTGLFFVHHGVGSEMWSEDGFTPI